MHYLRELAEKLVVAYEDEENFLEWVVFSDRARNRAALVSALHTTLEREVGSGHLSYHVMASQRETDTIPDLFDRKVAHG